MAAAEQSDCLFCRIARGDIPAALVHQDDELVAFEDINPQAPTHVLIIPRRHVETVNQFSPEDAGLAGRMVLCAATIAAAREADTGGYRLVFNCNADAGQTVFHVHLHLLAGRALGWPPG